MKKIGSIGLSVLAAVLFTVTAVAHVTVTVTCPDGTPLEGVLIRLSGTCNPGLPDEMTDANGIASFIGFNSACIGQELTVTALNFTGSTTFTFPASNPPGFPVTLIITDGPVCGAAPGKCWLTGGGVKFEPLVGDRLAEGGPSDTIGGNIFPGCSPTAGDGGQWNHVAHSLKLHFQGRAVEIVNCGNVDPSIIPPGSDSPKTPFNFIEFFGTGTLKGIKGNKVNFGPVYFFGRCEDHNEPGSNGAKAGALIDKYFLNVFTNPANPGGTSVFLFDVDGNPATVDPKTITGGNLQIHISSCP